MEEERRRFFRGSEEEGEGRFPKTFAFSRIGIFLKVAEEEERLLAFRSMPIAIGLSQRQMKSLFLGIFLYFNTNCLWKRSP